MKCKGKPGTFTAVSLKEFFTGVSLKEEKENQHISNHLLDYSTARCHINFSLKTKANVKFLNVFMNYNNRVSFLYEKDQFYLLPFLLQKKVMDS